MTVSTDSVVTVVVPSVNEMVVTPWGDRNARVRAPDGMQLTLFSLADD